MEHSDIIAFVSLLLPHFFLVAIVLGNWYMVESLNPQDIPSPEGGGQLHTGIKIVCFDQSRITTRYCATCRKQVYGMDHVSAGTTLHGVCSICLHINIVFCDFA